MSDSPDVFETTLAGQMLIATPVIGDPRFARSLVLVCAHTPEHAMGIIVNKPMGALRLPDLLEQLGIESSITVPDRPVLNGGPVDRDRGFVIHTSDFYSEDATLDIFDGVGMTATKDVLEAIASDEAPRQAILALGYAGWGAGQLENEILANAWLTCDPSDELLFGIELAGKWNRALASIGVSPEKLSTHHGEA
ncbi:MAG: YqgE/AlgH family protein [Maricaulaceae bacterium]|jgi:putative transcriptional regulator